MEPMADGRYGCGCCWSGVIGVPLVGAMAEKKADGWGAIGVEYVELWCGCEWLLG